MDKYLILRLDYYRTIFVFSLLLVVMLLASYAQASGVIMIGTRVIYQSDLKSKTLQFKNTDNNFNVVQIWTDVNNPDSTPDTADAPFFVNPPIFRMEANSGQSVRLIYTGGKSLPQDRESVFYLNFMQLPPTLKENMDKSRLQVLFRHRLKIFYRPAAIKENIMLAKEKQEFSAKRDGKDLLLTAKNGSSFFVTYRKATLIVGNGAKQVAVSIPMVAPKSTETVRVKNAASFLSNKMTLDYSIVSDQGGNIPGSFTIQS